MDIGQAHVPQPGSAPHLLRLIASGAATSRSDLVRLTDLAASTVSARVEQLLAGGFLREVGDGRSRGGRRPRRLEVHRDGGTLLAADFGAYHARIAAVDVAGRPTLVEEFPWDLAEGPERTVDWLVERLAEVTATPPLKDVPVHGLGIGLPGPIEYRTGMVVLPSRMPGWHGVTIREAVGERVGVPVVVDNDANLMAIGEHLSAREGTDHQVLVKAGSGIGCGVISSGQLHRGAAGAAGDISHVQVGAAGDRPCSCGNSGCLETAAGGRAIMAALADAGVKATAISDVVRMVEDGHPLAGRLVREAGHHLGEVLAVVVNFFNPEVVVLGGALSGAQPFVAAVRGVLYQRCLPLATRSLEIDTARTGPDAGVIGAGLLVLHQILAADILATDAAPAADATEPAGPE